MELLEIIKTIKRCMIPSKSDFGTADRNIKIGYPVNITTAKNVHMIGNTILRSGASIQNNKNENVYIKKYSVISMNVTIVTNNHRSTVGIPKC